MIANALLHPLSQRKANQWFWCFGLLHLLAWTLMPIISRGNPPFDSVEGVVWGNQWQWGYDKHPPLAPWLTALAVRVAGSVDWPIYFLGALSTALCFWAIWRLGNKILPAANALCGVMLLEGIYYYNISASQFNPNVLMLPLWALVSLNFYNAINRQRLYDWLLVGLFAGLAMMTKYETGLLLLSMLIFLLSNKKGRLSFGKPGFYCSAVLFLLIVMPNFIWLMQHDYIALTYTMQRVDTDQAGKYAALLNHIYHPLKYFFEQMTAILPAFLLFLPWRRAAKADWRISQDDKHYLLILGLGPFIIVSILSLFTGIWIHSLWAFPFFSLIGLLLMAWYKPVISEDRFRIFIKVWLLFFALLVTARALFLIVGPYTQHKTNSAQFPGKVISQTLTAQWRQRYHQPLAYVAGYRTLVEHVAAYSADQPKPYFEWNPKESAWIDESNLRKKGALFVWFTNELGESKLPVAIAERFPQAIPQPVKEFAHVTGAKNLEPLRVAFAFLPPNPHSIY